MEDAQDPQDKGLGEERREQNPGEKNLEGNQETRGPTDKENQKEKQGEKEGPTPPGQGELELGSSEPGHGGPESAKIVTEDRNV